MKQIMKNKIGQMYRGDLKWFLIMLFANALACGVAVLLIYFCI